MILRKLQARIENLFQHSPLSVVLLGPRHVGKTTLAQCIMRGRASVYIDLKDPYDFRKLNEPGYLKSHAGKLIVIDEVERKQDLFQILRGQIDRNRQAGCCQGQFLLLGSVSREFLGQHQFLEGRVSYEELFPLNVLEVGGDAMEQLWLRGGYPESFLDSKSWTFEWRRDLIHSYVDSYLPVMGVRITHETLHQFLTMLARSQGQVLNASELGRNLGISGQSVCRHLDMMASLMLVRRLLPWHADVPKRQVKSPKVYIRDSGILHALLEGKGQYWVGRGEHLNMCASKARHTLLAPSKLEDLAGHPAEWASWEGFVIENILSAIPPDASASFYCTAAGAEINLVLDFAGDLWAIGITLSESPKVSRGFHYACGDIKPVHKRLVYAGTELYETTHGIQIMSLHDLMQELSQLGF